MTKADDLRLLRGAFEYTLRELSPQPKDVEVLFNAVKRCFKGESGAAFKAAAPYLLPDMIWAERDRRIAEILASGGDPKRMTKTPIAELVVRRVVMMTYAMQRERDMLLNAKARRHWMFVSVPDSLNPAECAAKHDAIHPAGSAFFDAGPPCWRPDCRCRVRALADRQIERMKSTR